jgi:hypothetical protein
LKVKHQGGNGTSEYFSHQSVTYGISVVQDENRIIDEDGCPYDKDWHSENWELVDAIKWAKRKLSAKRRQAYEPMPSIVSEYAPEF